MSLTFSKKSVLASIMLLAALLLPYVSFEPAPIDFSLVLAGMIYIGKGGGLQNFGADQRQGSR